MDGFGDNFDQADIDPAAEFLAREKDQLAGLEDDVETSGISNLNLGGETTAEVNQSGMQQQQRVMFSFLFFLR